MIRANSATTVDARRSTLDASTVDATLVSTLDAPADARARLATRRRRDARVVGRARPGTHRG
jgi:hypothetical protein